MGLGLLGGGVATVKFLYSRGAKITVTDLKTKKELEPSLTQLAGKNIKYVLGMHAREDILNNDLIIQNPSVPKNSPYLALAEKKGIPIENDASIFFRYCPDPIIGVTGTKGKSTTVDLIRAILEQTGQKPILVGHNITPVLSRLKLVGRKRPILFELSSWRLARLSVAKKSPHVAVITNLLPDHLNKYRSFKEYVADKNNIFCYQKKRDYSVVNLDCPLTKKMGREVISQRFWFSQNYFPDQNGTFIRNNKIIFRKAGSETVVIDLNKNNVTSQILVENILPAITVAKILGIKDTNIVKALDKYRPLAGRCERLGKVGGITFINDTTATIPEATVTALNKFSQKLILIAGGEDKNLDYSRLSRALPGKTKSVHLIKGTATNKIIKLIKKRAIKYTVSVNLQKAFKEAHKNAGVGDIVILSPGAASFGKYFMNEFDRGRQFVDLVRGLKKQS